MTTFTATRPRSTTTTAGLRRHWAKARPIERACHLIGAVLILSGLFHLGVFAVRGGPWDGPVSWRKPATFGLSFGATLITVVWVASYLTLGSRARSWLLGIFAADCVLEVAGITAQAWRHVPSHFNTDSLLNTVVAMSLAVGGAVLIAVLGALAVAAFRRDIHAPPDMRLALRAGFALLMIGLAIGAAMIAKGQVLIKSGHRQAGYNTAGSLKWVHGVTLHGILVLPALALILGFMGMTQERRTRAIKGASSVYAMATIAVLVMSLLQ